MMVSWNVYASSPIFAAAAAAAAPDELEVQLPPDQLLPIGGRRQHIDARTVDLVERVR